MNYQVLARTWRPKNFTELVGQQHVQQALINALKQNRLHHAYLFTGTRGVGKTTIARILAKCLNCQQGITPTPCETCNACCEINEGRFIDLIEVDAASRTKVEDTRDLLENVQYTPTQGRFKIYLIDEVHMLSTHSFNALLKTLEEPPPHVKFILATTDPQKLPITILSRCLQFNLKQIPVDKIQQQLTTIVQQEKFEYEDESLALIAFAAEGSLRDALSILDQAISFCDKQLKAEVVRDMLGHIAPDLISRLINSLIENNAQVALEVAGEMATNSVDFTTLLKEIISLFHQAAIYKTTETINHTLSSNQNMIKAIATNFSAEDIQLYYEIALHGLRDIHLNPFPQMGFEMTLLRLFQFRLNPVIDNKGEKKKSPLINKPTETKSKNHPETWAEIVPQLKLQGPAQAIAQNAALINKSNDRIQLSLAPAFQALNTKNSLNKLQEALTEYFGQNIMIEMSVGNTELATPYEQKQQKAKQKQEKLQDILNKDSKLQQVINSFDGKILSNSINMSDEKVQ